ncbi:MAG: response regulator [Chloroherpetonaceae bacterium]|nr:response regulator [Chloroherpetonaceae bacterium]MDW8436646.1 response regulator [Chloroherpetonaceae bacterium]
MGALSNILLVDDEPLLLSSLSRVLRLHYTVFTAENGMQALDIVQRHNIKVIVSDQRMPGMLGHELLGKVKEISPNTVRLLLTGYSDLDAVLNSVNAGQIFRYINKPCSVEKLREMIELGVQIHDRIVAMQSEAKLAKTQPNALPDPPATLLFVGYAPSEVQRLTSKLVGQFIIEQAKDIDEAFAALNRASVSVLISELNFGEHDGIDFLNAVKKEFPHTVTIILTDMIDATMAIRSINEAQVFRYITKPAGEEAFAFVIEEAVKRHRAYQTTPHQNIKYTAEAISPDQNFHTSAEKLRAKLLAARIALSKPR